MHPLSWEAFIKARVCGLALDVLAEIPVIMNYGDMLDHVRAKQLMKCLYLYHMTIGNRGMALT